MGIAQIVCACMEKRSSTRHLVILTPTTGSTPTSRSSTNTPTVSLANSTIPLTVSLVRTTPSHGTRLTSTASATTREFVIAALANVRVSLVSKVRVADVSPAPTVAVDMVNVSTWLYLMLTTVHGTKRKLLNASVTLDTPVRTVPCASALKEVIPLPLYTSTTKAYTKSSGDNKPVKNGLRVAPSTRMVRCTGR